MNTIYEAIIERLESEVPELAYIGVDDGTLDMQGKVPPMDMPCAMIGLSLPSCEDISEREQNCQLVVAIRIAWNSWADEMTSRTPKEWREKSLRQMALPDKVYRALQGWGTEEFDDLSRTRMMPERRGDGISVIRVEFMTGYRDDADEG